MGDLLLLSKGVTCQVSRTMCNILNIFLSSFYFFLLSLDTVGDLVSGVEGLLSTRLHRLICTHLISDRVT